MTHILLLTFVLFGCTPGTVPVDGGTEPTEQTGDDTAAPADDYTDTPSVETDADNDGHTAENGDCDDSDATINPDAVDNDCDGIDQDCDGVDGNDVEPASPPTVINTCGGVDTDGDGYMDVDGDDEIVDCDDNDASVNPGATEICDEQDNDCDGTADEADGNLDVQTLWDDDDADGYGDTYAGSFVACPEDGFVEQSGDCDDTDASVNPGAEEIAYDGIDQDCDGYDLDDVDCDGYAIAIDCDDTDVTINPGASEVCSDGIDQNCDGSDEECDSEDDTDADGDGWSESEGDCDDSDADVNPDADETDFGIDDEDNDCDGDIDEDWQAYVEAEYSSTNYYVLNAGFYISGATPNSLGWQESDTETSGTTTSVEFMTSKYGDMSTSCGLIVNVNVGNPATDWYCVEWAIDESVALTAWFDGVWYDESNVVEWIADNSTGSCAAVIQTNASSSCTPVDDE